MTRLFVSYSRDDADIVSSVVGELEESGYEVWVDKNRIIGGKSWSTQLAEAISTSNFFLLFISSNSVKANHVRTELDLAHKNKSKIIPILLEKIEIPPEWDYPLAGIQRIEYGDLRWMSRLLDTLSDTENRSPIYAHSPITTTTTPPKGPSSTPDSSKTSVSSSSLIPNHIIDIFQQELVRPKECDIVIAFLRDLANNASLDPKDLNLQFALKQSILELVAEVESFRRICETVTPASDRERRKILARMEKLAQYSSSTQEDSKADTF